MYAELKGNRTLPRAKVSKMSVQAKNGYPEMSLGP